MFRQAIASTARVAAALALAGCGALVVLSALENRLIFFPTGELLGTPRDYRLDYESVEFETDDAVRLHGWWVPAVQARGVLLFFHGNAGNIGDRLDSIEIFHRLGLTVFIIDYRGYGRSEGEPSEEGTYRDAEAAWRYMVEERGVAPGRAIIFGRSLGAAVASHLAAGLDADEQPAALILESAFTSVPDMAASLFPFLPARLLARTRYDNLERMERLAGPILIIHSRDDEIIPFAHGRRLYESAPEPKAFIELRYGHNEGFLMSGSTYVDGLRDFLDRHLGGG